MPTTAQIHRRAAWILTNGGRHTGPQFVSRAGQPDLCAALFIAAEGYRPTTFATDVYEARAVIEASAPAMQAICALSASLGTEPPVTEIAPGEYIAEYIEHVTAWAENSGLGQTPPPTDSEVIGRLLRLADDLDAAEHTHFPHAA